ncbi:phage tail tape measure protein [Metabacillus sp. 22489]|uniref:phage tail tape measure protein n=1 Tax=Metabacillus sp. 22489 TaxID=3453928 RepID=UPI003F85C5BD
MANNLQIIINGILDQKETERIINRQLETIGKNLKVSIGLNSDELSKVSQDIQKIKKQIDGNKVKLVSNKDVLKSKEFYTNIEKAVEKYSQLGTVNINKTFNPATKELEKFVLKLEKANGQSERLTFELAKLKNIEGINGFVLTGKNVVDNTAAIREKQLQAEQKINKEIDNQNEKVRHQLEMFKEQSKLNSNNFLNKYKSESDNTGLRDWMKSVESLNESTPNLNHQMDKLRLQFKNIEAETKKSTAQVNNFGTAFENAFSRMPIYIAASAAIFFPIQTAQKFFDTLVEIDSQLTSIKKVMDDGSNISTILDQATESAQKFGRTISGALSAYEIFFKMGFDSIDSNILANSAMLLSTVGEMEDADAANSLVAAIRQYGMEVSDASKIVDVYNEISNNAGTTSEDLANAVAKAGSSANNAGVNFETLSAYASTVTESLKISGQEAGNFFKTFFTRIIRDDTRSQLEEIGVATTDVNGEFLQADKIIESLAAKWSSLSTEQRNSLGQALGGVYHINKVNTLLSNQSRTVESLEAAYNSYNSGQKELETFQESMQYKINQMTASFEGLAIAIGQNGAQDGITKIIELITFMTQGFTQLTEATDGWNIKLPILIGLVWGGVKAFGALKIALTGVKSSFGIFSVGLIAIETLASAFMGSASAADINTKALQENAQKTSDQADELERLVAKYNELSPQAQNSTEKQEELQGVLQQIQKIAPHLIESTGKYGDVLTLNKEKTDNYIASLREMTNEQLKQAQTANNIELSNVNVDIDKAKKELENMDSSVKDIMSQIEDYQFKFDVSGITDAEKEYIKRIDNMTKKADEALKKGDSALAGKISQDIQEASVEYRNYMQLMNNNGDELAKYTEKFSELQELEGKKDGIEQRSQALSDMINGTKSSTEANNENATSLQNAESALSSYGDEATETITAQDELNKRIQEAKDNFTELSSIVLELVNAKQYDQSVTVATVDAYNALANEVEPLNSLLEKMAEGKEISAAEAMKLIQQEEDLADAIDFSSGQIKINEKAVIDLRDSKVASYNVMIEAQNKELNAQKKALLAKLKLNETEIAGIKTVAQARYEANKQLNEEITNEDPLAGYLHSSQYMASHPVIEKSMGDLSKILEAQESLARLTEMASSGLTQVGTSMEDLSTSTDKANKETEKSVYVSDKYRLRLEQINVLMSQLNATKSRYAQHSRQYRNALEREIKLLKEQSKVYQQQQKDLKNQIKTGNFISYGKSSTPTTSSNATYNGKYASYINQAATKYGVNPFLIAAIIQQESGFNPKAVSPAGARGLMQLMPGTARDLGVSNSFDPFQNIMGGTKYIAQQLKTFGNDIQKALAAYNAGPGNVRKYGGIPPFRETQNYVNKVLANFNKLAGSANNIATTFSSASQSVADYYKNNFRVTSKFGQKESFRSSPHKGLDLANGKQGDPVKALRGGKVITAAYSKTAGYWVVVQQDDGTVAKYMHMQKGLNVKAGQKVSAGQQLGKVGNTGRSTGAHLHIQIEQNGKAIDPQKYMNTLNTSTSGVVSNLEAAENAQMELMQGQQQIAQINEQIQQLYGEIVNSRIAEYQRERDLLNDDIAIYERGMANYIKGSKDWNTMQQKREAMMGKQMVLYTQEIGYIKQQMKYNKNLSAEQKASLVDQLTAANEAYYQMRVQFQELQMELINGRVALYQRERSLLEDNIAVYERGMSIYAEGSAQWLTMQQKRQATMGKQMVFYTKEIQYMKNQLKLNKSLSKQQRADLTDMIAEANEAYYQLRVTFQSQQMEHIDAVITRYQREQDLLNDNLAILEHTASREEEMSKEWIEDMSQRKELLEQQKESQWILLKYLENQLKTNKSLSAEQREQLKQKITEAAIQYNSLRAQYDGLNDEFLSAQESLADKVVEMYKEAYEQQRDSALKAIDEEQEAFEKAHNEKLKMLREEREDNSFENDLAKRQEEIAELQKLRNAHLMDDSNAGQARAKELEEEIKKAQEDLQEFLSEREYSQREKALEEQAQQKQDAFNEEREKLNEHYDNLLNDESKFQEIRQQVILGNIKAISNELMSFAHLARQNMEYIGKSITDNFIDSISEVRHKLKDFQGEFQRRAIIKKPTSLVKGTNESNLKYVRQMKKGENFEITGYSEMNGGMYRLGNAKSNLWVSAKDVDLEFLPFKSGGYTGNDEGLAMLHEKELVLNKDDTKNVLSAVNMLRPNIKNIKQPEPPKLNQPSFANAPTISLSFGDINIQGTKNTADMFFKDINNRLSKSGVNIKL